MRRRGKLVDDNSWAEVQFGNHHALFMGYVSMAVKGLGFLVLTWTTVVLLGGFVSTLEKKDFWCLTFITLVQTAGIFDVLLTEKLRYIGDSFWGVLISGYAVLSSNPLRLKCKGFATAIGLIQAVVYCIPLCPLAAVYMFGLYISAGISVWRLRLHDYGNDADGDGHGNLKPALNVLYSLALLQGVIFCLRSMYNFLQGSMVSAILKSRRFGDQYRVGVSDYLVETMTGCEKDPSFARGRNLITYAVDMIGSKSPDDYLSGVRILDTFARRREAVARNWEEESSIYTPRDLKRLMQEHVLMKYLIMATSSTDLLQKLLHTLGLKSIYDRETRECAARIVANMLASDIRLEELPQGIFHISSLIDTFAEYRQLQPYERDWVYESFEQDWMAVALLTSEHRSHEDDRKEDSDTDLQNTYNELMVQGFRILQKLATNLDNCRVMLHTPYLLQKIMAPVTSDLLHHIDHGAWSNIVEGALKVIAQLTAATGQTGNKLRTEISSNNEAINTMERILKCDKCDAKLQKQVILILKHLYEDTALVMGIQRKENFIESLVNIICDDKMDKEARRKEAAIALVDISSKTESCATIIMKANGNFIHLTKYLLDLTRTGPPIGLQIMENLSSHDTGGNESIEFTVTKEAMAVIALQMLKALLSATEETHTGTEVDQDRFMKPETDVENQGGDSQDNGRGNDSSLNQQQNYIVEEYEAVRMLSFTVTICDTLISEDQDLAHQIDAIAPRDGAFSFPRKLKEFVKKYMHPRANCMEIMKLTCKMVISMMKHRGTYVKEDLQSLMDTLSTASKVMFLVEGSMVFDVTHDNAAALKPSRSLASLVKEAQELVDKHYGVSS
ncbi:hypothetical protein ACQ4PT_070003 [Festuca glaucescens]